MFDYIDDATKRAYLARATAYNFHYNSLNISKGLSNEAWGYHSSNAEASLFSAIFAYDPIMNDPIVTGDPVTYGFDVHNYLHIAMTAVAPGGKFLKYERLVAGDMTQ